MMLCKIRGTTFVGISGLDEKTVTLRDETEGRHGHRSGGRGV